MTTIPQPSSADPSPNALCYCDAFPESGVPAVATVLSDALTVELLPPEFARQFRLPFDAVHVQAGGFDHDQLVLQWTGETDAVAYTLYIKDATVIAALRRAAGGRFGEQLHETAAAVRRHRSRGRTVLLSVLFGLIVGAVGLWAASDVLTAWAVARVPLSWEETIGESAYRQFLASHTVVRDGPAVDAVQQIEQRLTAAIPASPYTFRVTVVESGEVNAFALPGGYIVVFTGLLKKAERAEEVAGVMGHEINHVLKRHAVGRIVRSLGIMSVITIVTGNQQGWVGLVRELGLELATLSFSREQETEADLEGVRLLHRAHVAPDGMVTFFERLGREAGAQIELLSSHPLSEERAARIKAEMAQLPPSSPETFAVSWPAVVAALK
ncbi:MAG: M48 family metallopeptidase [Nitrospiraceae bacterium]